MKTGSPRRLRILISCPAPRGSRRGNRITAQRWAAVLRELGHCVRIAQGLDDRGWDVLVALHARRSAASVREARSRWPDRKVVVVLTGTDLYGDLPDSRIARASLQAADHLVVLHPAAKADLPAAYRSKVHVIVQSGRPQAPPHHRPRRFLQVCVLGHLRAVKDPFRAALAVLRLRDRRGIRVVQAGAALTPGMARRARALEQRVPQYRWLGELSAARARRLLGASHVMVISSRSEGGANVVSEALAAGVPILASRVPGNLGLLGGTYPGYFEVGDTAGLAALLDRAVTTPAFLDRLQRACLRRAILVDPARERAAWQTLLGRLAVRSSR